MKLLRDLDLIRSFSDVRVSWSVNTLDEDFKDDMDKAVSIERRLSAIETFHKAVIMEYIREKYPQFVPLYHEIPMCNKLSPTAMSVISYSSKAISSFCAGRDTPPTTASSFSGGLCTHPYMVSATVCAPIRHNIILMIAINL